MLPQHTVTFHYWYLYQYILCKVYWYINCIQFGMNGANKQCLTNKDIHSPMASTYYRLMCICSLGACSNARVNSDPLGWAPRLQRPHKWKKCAFSSHLHHSRGSQRQQPRGGMAKMHFFQSRGICSILAHANSGPPGSHLDGLGGSRCLTIGGSVHFFSPLLLFHKASAASEPTLMGCHSRGQPIRMGAEAPAASGVGGVGIFAHSSPPETAGAQNDVPDGFFFHPRIKGETSLEHNSRHQQPCGWGGDRWQRVEFDIICQALQISNPKYAYQGVTPSLLGW